MLRVLTRTLSESGLDWDIWVTKGERDAVNLAARAMDERADVVAVYAGDGTVAEVGGVLAGSEVSLAFFPVACERFGGRAGNPFQFARRVSAGMRSEGSQTCPGYRRGEWPPVPDRHQHWLSCPNGRDGRP